MYVGDESGTPLGGAAAQRRLLALLAVLAVAGDAGLSREKLLALLWPETEPEKARHALTQSLYHARRALRHDDLFLAGGDVRLNRERMDSDVQEFERALAAGELEPAAAAYQGPFLDGFFLSGSAEFEQWATAQRARLAQRMAAILERLAARAEERADHRHAVEWRRRAVALDPLDSGATVRLMSALAAAGDRAGALQHARVHELLLRDSLDVAPDPAVSALATRLRLDAEHAAATPPAGAPAIVPGLAPPADPAVPHGAAAGAGGGTAVLAPPEGERDTPAAPAAAAPPAAEPAAPEASRRRGASWRRGWRPVAIAVLLLAVAGSALAFARLRWGKGAPRPAPQAVVVAPFRVTGADRSLAYLREGMVELLSTRLADDTAARAVDPGAVLTAWRAAGFTSDLDVPRDSAVRVAAQFAAAHVVVGSVVGSPSKMVVTASLVAVPSGAVQAQATVEGPADSLTTVIDRLAARLIAAEAGEGERFLSHVTPSLAALRAYLDGRAAYRRGSFATAARAYERALQLDSTFALAALHLAVTADRLNDAAQHDRALALAWAARDDLGASDQAHLVAFAGPSYPAPSTEAEQLAAWERAVALAPERAEVWEELGERFYYDGAMLGMADARERASAAFRRALELDPTFVPARRFLVLLAAREGDVDALERLATQEALRDSLGSLAPFLRWRVAVARGDERAERQARAVLGRFDDANLRVLALSSQFDAVNLDDGERALHILRTRAARATDVLDAVLGQHSLALNEGRPALALALTSQLEDAQPGARAHLRLRVLDALYGGGDTAAAASAARELARVVEEPPPAASAPAPGRAAQAADACVLAQWRLSRGETRGVKQAIALLRDQGVPHEPVLVGASPIACAEILDAQLAVVSQQREALDRVRRLDSLMLGGPAAGDAGSYAYLVVARLYERLGEPERALSAIRRRAYMNGWPRYLATAWREEGSLAERVGEKDAARRAYSRYLALRRAPEGPVALQVAEVRVALGRLQPAEDR